MFIWAFELEKSALRNQSEHLAATERLGEVRRNIDLVITAADLVIGSGEPYTSAWAISQCRALQNELESIAESQSILASKIDTLNLVEYLEEIAKLVGMKARYPSSDVSIDELDFYALKTIELFYDADSLVNRSYDVARENSSKAAKIATATYVFGVMAYLAIASILALLASRLVASPLVRIQSASMTEDTSILHPDAHNYVPREIRLLEKNIYHRINNLNRLVEERTDGVAEREVVISQMASMAQIGYSFFDDDKKKYTFVSDVFAKIFGYTPDEFLKKIVDTKEDMYLVYYPDRERYRKFDEGMHSDEIEYRIVHRDGSIKHVHEIVQKFIHPSNSQELWLCVLQDITERKMTEAQVIQSAKLSSLGEMATSIAHEINQPLNVIRLAADNMLRGAVNGEIELDQLKNKRDRIQNQISRAEGIIDHLRRFGREANEELYLLDPWEAVKGSIDMMGEQLRLAGISVDMNIPSQSPQILGHQNLLEQVIINLFTNSMHAIEKSAPTEKKISVATRSNTQGALVLTFEDTGGGVDDEALNHIFEPFYTTKGFKDGTGLGLSVSYRIVCDLGGIMRARNGHLGLCIEIILPVYEEDENSTEELAH